MNECDKIKNTLSKTFSNTHTASILKHYSEAILKYRQSDWENSLLKSGKFIESVIKTLFIYTGGTLPPARQFKVYNIVQQLNQSSGFDDTIRLTIPRLCVFVYDIVSNRGTRHDSADFDPNKMDASVTLPAISWILAEMIRFSDQVSPNNDDVMNLMESIIEKKDPIFENIDGKTYINQKGLSPKEVGILLLYASYPNRLIRKNLMEAIKRHGSFTDNSIAVALTNIKDIVDEDEKNGWKLREIGRQKAVRILDTLHS